MKKIKNEVIQTKTSFFLFVFFICTIINFVLRSSLTVRDLFAILVETIVIAFFLWQLIKSQKHNK